MMGSNKLFSFKKQKISPKTTEIYIIRLHKECQGKTPQISHNDWAQSSVDSCYT